MANDLELKIRIAAELKELRAAIQTAQGDIKRFADQAEKAGDVKGFDRLDARLKGITGSLKGLAGGFATLATLKTLVDMADQAKTLNARLALATNSTEELAIAQAGLFDIAQQTRTDLTQTVELYSKLALATKEAGVSQGELLRVTETIGKAVQLSGSSAESANAAIIQLAQGIASGTLRGEELNSVLEQTPRLAQAIAAGMGVGIGELRKLGQEGKITADTVIGALLEQGAVLDEEFKKLPLTVAGSITQLKNSVMAVVGQFDVALGSSDGLARAIAGLAEMIQDIDLGPVIEEFEQFASVAGVTFEEVTTLVGAFVMGLEEGLGKDGADAVQFLIDAFKNLPANIRALVQLTVVEIAAFKDRFLTIVQGMKEGYAAIFTDDTIDEAERRMNERLKAIDEARRSSVETILQEREAHINAGKAARERFDEERKARERASNQAKAATKAANDSAKNRTKQTGGEDSVVAVNQAALLKADVEAQMRELDRLYQDGKVKLEEYYTQKKALSKQVTDLEVKDLEQRLKNADKAAEKSKILTEIELAKKRGASTLGDISNEETKDRETRLKEAEGLQIELAQIENRGADARRLQLEQKYRDTLERMKLEGDTKGVEIIEKIINTEVSKAKFEELKQQADRAIEDLRNKEESLANRVLTGDISQAEADVSLQEQRQITIDQLTTINEKMQELAATTNDPTIIEGANNIAASLQKIGTEGATGVQAAIQSLNASLADLQKNMTQSLANSAVDGLTTLFTDIANGSKGAKEAVADFARGFAQAILQMIARALALQAVLLVLNAIPGGAAIAQTLGMTAGVKHTGGVVGMGGSVRSVNPSLFAAAPRYHTGGVAGLQPGEVPAILQTGEEVLSRNDPRNVMNGGGQQSPGNGVRIVNVIDPNMVADYMASSGGEQVILNTLQRNSGSVKQILGG